MSGHVWVCNTCGHKSVDGPAVFAHRTETGHIGSRVQFDRDELTGELPAVFRKDAS